MILIDAYPEGAYTFQNVGVDDYSGGYQIGEYLYSCGYHKALFVAETEKDSDYYRWMGFKQAMEKKGGFCSRSRYMLFRGKEIADSRNMKSCFRIFLKTKALAFSSDYAAIEAINFFDRQGNPVPDQISITGYDDSFYAHDRQAKLTTSSSGCSSESSSGLAEAASYGRGKGTCRKKCKKPCLACKERFCKRVAGSLFFGTSSKYGWKLFLEASSALLLKLHKKNRKVWQ